MTADQLLQFRTAIQRRLEETHSEIANTRSELLQIAEIQPNALRDGLDHAREEVNLNTKLELHDRTRKLQTQLRDALERIAHGSFGICAICEEEIDLRRLQVQPTAVFCLKCQTIAEREIAKRIRRSGELFSDGFTGLNSAVA